MRGEGVFEAPPQPELPEMHGSHVDPTTGEDEFSQAEFSRANVALGLAPTQEVRERDPNDPATWGKVGRNEPCPCGSGKKFKHCHGRLA
jgi:preprotein translocase subunit SecA